MIFPWWPSVNFQLLNSHRHLMNIIIQSDSIHQPWNLTFVHCPLDWTRKELFWEKLNDIDNIISGPWLILGDFNALLSNFEKSSGRPFVSSSQYGLYQLMLNCGLVDIGFIGNLHTWCN